MKNNWLKGLSRRALLVLGAVLLPLLPALAQQTAVAGPEMADQMRQDGKIYRSRDPQRAPRATRPRARERLRDVIKGLVVVR